jgi:hypothetical protein
MYDMSQYKKIRRCFRIDSDMHVLIPELIRRKGLKENLSEFFRVAARERFNALAKLPDVPAPTPATLERANNETL